MNEQPPPPFFALLLPALIYWFALLAVAVAAGGLRDLLLAPWLGPLRAHQAGTLLACAGMAWVAARFARRFGLTPRQGLRVGALWTALAVAFEFAFFGLVMGRSWAALLADYRIWRGRLLPLVWLTVLLAPWLATRRR